MDSAWLLYVLLEGKDLLEIVLDVMSALYSATTLTHALHELEALVITFRPTLSSHSLAKLSFKSHIKL